MKYSISTNYNSELKVSGNTVTFKFFQKKQQYGYTSICSEQIDFKEKEKEIKKEERIQYRERANRRAKKNIFDLIASNISKFEFNGKKQSPKFLTLTFKENIKDIKKANLHFSLFLKRLNYFHGEKKAKLKYLAVPEVQQRGAWHYHVVFFNLPYTSFNNLLNIWNLGSVFINKIKIKNNDSSSVAKYITKYLNKSIDDENNIIDLLNIKRYFTSRGLYKPIKRRAVVSKQQKQDIYDFLLEFAKNSPFYKNYYNDYRGEISIFSVDIENKAIPILISIFESLVSRNKVHKKINWEKIKDIYIRKMIAEIPIF